MVLQQLCSSHTGQVMARPAFRVSSYRARVSLFLILILGSLTWSPLAKISADAAESVIAIGDVHNDFDDFVAILRRTGLIDSANHWAGGKATFVQVGDLLDRGPKPREVMNLMMALEKEAPQSGGRVISLLGNHEVMNIMGDLRYVVPMNYASFADANSEKRRKEAYQEYVKWRDGHAPLVAELTQPMEMTEPEWMARHPAGFIEQREALGPKGQYGEWLRQHAAVAEIAGVIFLHGGIHPDLATKTPDSINDGVHREIKEFDELKQYFQDEKLTLPFFNLQEMANVLQAEVIAELKSRVPSSDERQSKIREFLKFQDWLGVRVDGPLWFRGYDQWSDDVGAPLVSKVLEEYKATHVVVGHTVQKGGRIRPRFGNKLFLIDTGMLNSYYAGGRASALDICGNGKFVAVYLDKQVLLNSPEFSFQGEWPGGHRGGEEGTAASEKAGLLPPERTCSEATP